MSAPFFEYGIFGPGTSLLAAVMIGLAFGFFLEQGGMGNARKLAGQFYLSDLSVFKIMSTAVVTASVGLYWLGRLGVLNLALVYVPATWVVPQLLGGIIFGAGFVMGGLCPGTSCVAISTGRLDGLALLAGMFTGILLFGEAFPVVQPLFEATPRGSWTLPELSGLPEGTAVLLLTLGALAAFRWADRIERRTQEPSLPTGEVSG